MTNYQWKAFQNVANNDGSAKTYTKADIEKAQELYRKGGFTADMSQDLPSGYKIEKPKLDSKQDYVQVDVTNGKSAQSATLKFQIQEISELKAASQASQPSFYNRLEIEPLNISYEGSLMPDPEDVAKYREKFKDMSPEDIVKKLHWQISGPSFAKKTLAMYDAIPDDKLKDVLNIYQHKETRTNLTSYISGIAEEEKYFNLFTHMADEENIGEAELRPRIARYIDTQKEAIEEKDNSLPVNDDYYHTLEENEADEFRFAYRRLMKNISDKGLFDVYESSKCLAKMGLSQYPTGWEYVRTTIHGY